MWKYLSKSIDSHADLPDEVTDIVYIIYYTDGTSYIGKKTIRSERRLKPTKAQLAIRKNYVRKEVVDLPFVNYKGSSKNTGGKTIGAKDILYLCTNKRTATYLETKMLFQYDILFNSYCLNENISGKFFTNAMDGLYKEKDK